MTSSPAQQFLLLSAQHGSRAIMQAEAVLCRISRDVTERGRDVAVVIEQYTSQVKPAFERFVGPSRKHADVIIPWSRRAPGTDAFFNTKFQIETNFILATACGRHHTLVQARARH